MKSIFLFCLVLLIVQTCLGQEREFYNKILNYENCRYCYFLSLNVETGEYKGKVVVANDHLYEFFSKSENFDKSHYKEFIMNLLLNKKPLVLKNASVDKDGFFLNIKGVNDPGFRIVKEFRKTEELALTGCVPFIKYYFLEDSMTSVENSNSTDCHEFIRNQREDLSLSKSIFGIQEENVIIDRLFDWKIPVKIEAFSGLLTIRPVDLKENSKTMEK